MPRPAPETGIDTLLGDPALRRTLAERRVGVLTNDACRTAAGATTAAALHAALGPALACVFAPEHGAAAVVAAGAPVGHGTHAATGLPAYSLYGAARPTPIAHDAIAHARTLDAVVIDLRDIGVRCYTYATTAADLVAGLCGSATEVIVCDRPNPIGNARAGAPPQLRSFLAYFDVPFVHGDTLGGLLRGFHAHLGADKPQLTVVPASTQRAAAAWVPPSPALAHPAAVALYPGLVLLEGTNVNEGRGTPLPFRSATAPWLGPTDAAALATAANRWPATAITARPWTIRPQGGSLAHGIALRVAEPRRVDAFAFGVRLLCHLAGHPGFRWTTARVRPRALPWHPPPPPGRVTRPIIDTLFGAPDLRRAIAAGKTADAIIRDQRSAPPAPCPEP